MKSKHNFKVLSYKKAFFERSKNFHTIKKRLKKETLRFPLILLLFFTPSLGFSYMAGTACLHPIEQAALFHGNRQKPLSKQIEDLEKKLEREEEKREKYIEGEGRTTGLEEILDELSESLDDNDSYDKLGTTSDGYSGTDAVARLLSDYMEGEEDSLDDSQKIGMPWENNEKKYFKRNGKVHEDHFCNDFAKNKSKKCKEALKDLRKVLDKIKIINRNIDSLEENLEILDEKRDFGDDTEGNGLCFECLDEVRALDKPSSGQIIGSTLSVLAGGALSYYGYRSGKRSTRATNNLRMQQGYDPLGTAGPAWAGASLGLPFISQGIYGLAGGNSQFGSYACNNGSFGYSNGYHPFGGGMGGGMYGGMGGGMMGGGMMGMPYGMMGFPGGMGGGIYGGIGGGFPMGGGLYGGINIPGGFPMGAGIYGGIGGGFPMAGGMYGGIGGGFPMGGGLYGGINIPGGFPMGAGIYGGIGGGFPMAGGMYGGMGGGFPMAGGMMGGMGGGFPMAGGMMGGGFPGANSYMLQAQMARQQQHAQYLQFQQQQMQARIEAQQAWLQHQQSVQKDWANRQKVIGGLTQEMFKIQQQIQMVASGSVGSSSFLGAGNSSISAGFQAGLNSAGPATGTPAPKPSTPIVGPQTTTQDDLPIIDSR